MARKEKRTVRLAGTDTGRLGCQWLRQLEKRLLGVLLSRCFQAWRSSGLGARRRLQRKLNVLSYRVAMRNTATALLRCALHTWVAARERAQPAAIQAVWREAVIPAPPGLVSPCKLRKFQ